jgi:hypothetical protein
MMLALSEDRAGIAPSCYVWSVAGRCRRRTCCTHYFHQRENIRV